MKNKSSAPICKNLLLVRGNLYWSRVVNHPSAGCWDSIEERIILVIKNLVPAGSLKSQLINWDVTTPVIDVKNSSIHSVLIDGAILRMRFDNFYVDYVRLSEE